MRELLAPRLCVVISSDSIFIVSLSAGRETLLNTRNVNFLPENFQAVNLHSLISGRRSYSASPRLLTTLISIINLTFGSLREKRKMAKTGEFDSFRFTLKRHVFDQLDVFSKRVELFEATDCRNTTRIFVSITAEFNYVDVIRVVHNIGIIS